LRRRNRISGESFDPCFSLAAAAGKQQHGAAEMIQNL
jgi:hypothetical protein